MNPPSVESPRSEAPATWPRALMEDATLAPPPRSPRSVTDEYWAAAGPAESSTAMQTPTNTLHGDGVSIGASFGERESRKQMREPAVGASWRAALIPSKAVASASRRPMDASTSLRQTGGPGRPAR